MIPPEVAAGETHSGETGGAAEADGPAEIEPPAAVRIGDEEEADVRDGKGELCDAGKEEGRWRGGADSPENHCDEEGCVVMWWMFRSPEFDVPYRSKQMRISRILVALAVWWFALR